MFSFHGCRRTAPLLAGFPSCTRALLFASRQLPQPRQDFLFAGAARAAGSRHGARPCVLLATVQLLVSNGNHDHCVKLVHGNHDHCARARPRQPRLLFFCLCCSPLTGISRLTGISPLTGISRRTAPVGRFPPSRSPGLFVSSLASASAASRGFCSQVFIAPLPHKGFACRYLYRPSRTRACISWLVPRGRPAQGTDFAPQRASRHCSTARFQRQPRPRSTSNGTKLPSSARLRRGHQRAQQQLQYHFVCRGT